MLELYHNDMSVCAQKVRMVLAEKNLDWVDHHLDIRAGDQFKPEFIKLSPKAVVPVLVHDGRVIVESNAIIEYLDEAFPDPALMPADPYDRAILRRWLIELDAELHVAVAVISFCIAFRHQILQANPTSEALEAFYQKIPDMTRAIIIREMVSKGLDSARLMPSLAAYDKTLKKMDKALKQGKWLVGEGLSLADFAYAPYITRLSQLQLAGWWRDLPDLARWFDQIQRLPSYRSGIGDWNNSKYLGLMEANGAALWPEVEQKIRTLHDGK